MLSRATRGSQLAQVCCSRLPPPIAMLSKSYRARPVRCGCHFCRLSCDGKASTNFFFLLYNFTIRSSADVSNLRAFTFLLKGSTMWLLLGEPELPAWLPWFGGDVSKENTGDSSTSPAMATAPLPGQRSIETVQTVEPRADSRAGQDGEGLARFHHCASCPSSPE